MSKISIDPSPQYQILINRSGEIKQFTNQVYTEDANTKMAGTWWDDVQYKPLIWAAYDLTS